MHTCDDSARAYCINTEGSYECVCKPGYIGNGESCVLFGINHNRIVTIMPYTLPHTFEYRLIPNCTQIIALGMVGHNCTRISYTARTN